MTLISEIEIGSKAPAATLSRGAPLRALVVDDDLCLLSVVHQMVEALGFRVDAATGGIAAMRYLSQSRYDLMVTDLQMPDMDGYALSGWLKHKFNNTKVIVMTGSTHSNVVNYINTGIVDRWMFKPFSLTKLAEIVGELVATYRLRRFADIKRMVAIREQYMTKFRQARRELLKESRPACNSVPHERGKQEFYSIVIKEHVVKLIICDHWSDMTLFQSYAMTIRTLWPRWL